MESYSKEDILQKLTQVAYNEYYTLLDQPLDVKNYIPKFNFFPFFNDVKDKEKLFDDRVRVTKMIEENVSKWIKEEKKILEEKGFS